jgi:pimeloyl-ACP methyl ester carboxylesterase
MKRATMYGPLLLAGAMVLALPGCRAENRTKHGETAEAARASGEEPAALRPARTGYADSAGARIYYAVYGDLDPAKTPLLVLHGSLMSGEAMAPIVAPFAATRPVITVDARGHGHTGDVPGPITYQIMADDGAAVLAALRIGKADVLGYSMGGTTAIQMAVRHPDRIGKQVIVSAPAWRRGWYPKVQASFEQWTPEMFAGSPVERAYRALSAHPDDFPRVIGKLRELEKSRYDVAPDALRAIPGKTMIFVGDSDGVDLRQAIALFEARGGPDPAAATKGFIAEAPRVRLAILPATSHVGMAGAGALIAQLAIPFLDDRPPPPPSGFFKGMDQPPDRKR